MAKRCELGRFIGVFRGSFRSVKGGFVVLGYAVVFGLIIGFLKGGSVENLISAGPDLVLGLGALAAILLLYTKYHAVRIYSDGIEGKSYWGLSVRFLWSRVNRVVLDSSYGIPAVVLTETDSKRQMWIFAEVFFREDFQSAIRPYIDAGKINE